MPYIQLGADYTMNGVRPLVGRLESSPKLPCITLKDTKLRRAAEPSSGVRVGFLRTLLRIQFETLEYDQ